MTTIIIDILALSCNRKPGLSLSNSFKDERRSGEYQYRRTVSDSNTRLPDSSHHMPLTNGPLEEQPSMNGDTPTPTNHSTDSSPNSTIFVPSPGPIPGKTIPNPAQPVVNGPGGDAHKTQPNRSTGSTSSDDDRKRSTPTRTLASSSATSKRDRYVEHNTFNNTPGKHYPNQFTPGKHQHQQI
ncbi:LOW QUALITY PROTEIN: hypothetical protein MAR_013049 [Mya arenaria]|uniref:Uncharacterized protein n=1 Tax=Mya arenaria TaxID=6604 RepID=A0ABY7FZF5_MYAAR|nr:LOW QUALITY PROTEIN: hypothetical protein MAR_013049 [Mya arenaria]